MAQIVQKTLTISLSKLVKTSDADSDIDTSSLNENLEVLVAELINDPSIIVEVTHD